MSRIVDGLKKTAKEIANDQDFREGLSIVISAAVAILVAVIRRR